MAIYKVAYNGKYIDNHQEFTCDTRADIAVLPTQVSDKDRCPTGSKAFVISDSSTWMLNSVGEWVEININHDGNTSGEITNSEIATDGEVEDMLNDIFK